MNNTEMLNNKTTITTSGKKICFLGETQKNRNKVGKIFIINFR